MGGQEAGWERGPKYETKEENRKRRERTEGDRTARVEQSVEWRDCKLRRKGQIRGGWTDGHAPGVTGA